VKWKIRKKKKRGRGTFHFPTVVGPEGGERMFEKFAERQRGGGEGKGSFSFKRK